MTPLSAPPSRRPSASAGSRPTTAASTASSATNHPLLGDDGYLKPDAFVNYMLSDKKEHVRERFQEKLAAARKKALALDVFQSGKYR